MKHIEVTMQFSKTIQTIFGCKETDILTIFPFNEDIQTISLGKQNITICNLKINPSGVYFYFLDPSGALLHFRCGTADKVVNDKIRNKLINAFLKYFKKY